MLEAIINENIQWKETARQKNIFVRLNSCMIYLRMLLYMNIHIMIFIATKFFNMYIPSYLYFYVLGNFNALAGAAQYLCT